MATLETAARLVELPGVDRAVRAGELSAVQANEIASAAGADRGAEAELLAVARDDGVAGARQVPAGEAAAAPDEMARHRATPRVAFVAALGAPTAVKWLARHRTDDTGTIAERQARICDAAIARIEGRGPSAA